MQKTQTTLLAGAVEAFVALDEQRAYDNLASLIVSAGLGTKVAFLRFLRFSQTYRLLWAPAAANDWGKLLENTPRERWEAMSFDVQQPDGELLGVIVTDHMLTGISMDQTEVVRLATGVLAIGWNYQYTVRKLAEHVDRDPLSGLMSYNATVEQLKNQIELARRYDRTLSCLLISTDRFDELATAKGRNFANVVMAGIGEAVREVVRSTDFTGVVGPNEFLLILPGTGGAGAEVVANRLVTRLSRTLFKTRDRKSDGYITVTAGLSRWYPSMSWSSMLDGLRRAVQEGQAEGGNQVSIASHGTEDAAP